MSSAPSESSQEAVGPPTWIPGLALTLFLGRAWLTACRLRYLSRVRANLLPCRRGTSLKFPNCSVVFRSVQNHAENSNDPKPDQFETVRVQFGNATRARRTNCSEVVRTVPKWRGWTACSLGSAPAALQHARHVSLRALVSPSCSPTTTRSLLTRWSWPRMVCAVAALAPRGTQRDGARAPVNGPRIRI